MDRRRLTFASWLSLLALVGGLLVGADPRPGAATAEPSTAAAGSTVAMPGSRLPVTFEPNVGQAGDEVAFIARGAGYHLDLNPAALELTVGRSSPTQLRMQLVGANPDALVRGQKPQPGRVNHFFGDDPEQWHVGIPTFASVVYESVYPGIDLVVKGNGSDLEYDFVVAPGVDPALVALAFPGAEAVSLDPSGDLALAVAGHTVRHHRPYIYQEIAGEQVAVAGGFVIDAVGRVGFEVAGYDTSLPLVIDPVIEYSTTLSGPGEETAHEVVVDAAGNAYVSGYTTSQSDFPQTTGPGHAGEWDGFVVKLNDAGAVVWATYFGGSGFDVGAGTAIDDVGNVFVTGVTTSDDFPMAVDDTDPNAEAAQPTDPDIGGIDGFVMKLDDMGGLAYSTYLGSAGSDNASGIAVDDSGRVYVTGQVGSADAFADTTGAYRSAYQGGTTDGFVVIVAADGSDFEYATFLGGSGREVGGGLALTSGIDPLVYVTGWTTSTDFSGAAGYQATLGGSSDVYVVALDPSQVVPESQLVFATYVGGSDEDVGRDIAVDADGSVYVTGWTEALTPPPHSGQYPTTVGAYDRVHEGPWDSFVTKLLPDGSDLVYSTLLGGSVDDFTLGIAVNDLGEAHVAGWTTSTDFPLVDSILADGHSGAGDAFLARLSADGAVLAFSGLFGGTLHDAATQVALDAARDAYITGTSYVTGASDADAWVQKLTPTTGDAIYVWRAPGLNGTPITLAEAERLADFAVAEGIGTIFYDNWGCGPAISFNEDFCPQGLVAGAEAQVAADLIPILQTFHAHGLRVEALYTEWTGAAAAAEWNADLTTPVDARFDAVRLNIEGGEDGGFPCEQVEPTTCTIAGETVNDIDVYHDAVAAAGTLPVFVSVGHSWTLTPQIQAIVAGIDVQVVQINDASYDSADGRAIEFLSSDEVCLGNDLGRPVQITIETQDVMSYILDKNGNPRLNPWNTFYENGPDYMETKLTEIDFTDSVPERDPDYVPPCTDPYPQPHGIAYHFYRESFGSTIFPHWALDEDDDRIAEGDPHDAAVANVDTEPGTSSAIFSDGTTSGYIVAYGHQNLMVADAEDPNDGIVITASYETIPIGQTNPDDATIAVNPPNTGGECIPPAVPDPATVTTLTIDAGDQVIATCSSIGIDVVQGDVEAAFTASDGTVATTTMAQGNEVTFEPETATFTAPPTNPDPVVITVGGEEISVEPGETVDADAAITSITGPVAPLEVGTVVDMAATLTNPDPAETHSATWDWGDGTQSAGVVNATEGTVAGDHSYETPGVYTVALTVSDDQGSSDTEQFEFIVAYDPDAGFVTGGGWFDSPPGALVADSSATGKANFGYVAKYKKGQSVPDGQTQFQFKAGDLELHSTEYDWLVVTGNDTARFKGDGLINGEDDVKFQIWAYDDPDAIRIKIWSEDEAGNETLIYDTLDAIDLGGGNIQVHADD